MSISTATLTGIMSAFIFTLKSSIHTNLFAHTDYEANKVLTKIIHGTATTTGLRQFHMSHISVVTNQHSWVFSDSTTNGFAYNFSTQTLNDINGNLIENGITDMTIRGLENNTLIIQIEKESNEGGQSQRKTYSTTVQCRNQ